jgi:phospholipid/cholesterol/gamma-HCH transport system substrate-binding protein
MLLRPIDGDSGNEEERHISAGGSGNGTSGGRTGITRNASSGRVSLATRVIAITALGAAVVVVAFVLLSSGSSYKLSADFQDAGGLVTGDVVLIGPARVGTIGSIGLTPQGAAQVTMSLDSNVGPLHQGTVARIYEDSLSGIANKYVELEPASKSAPSIPSGGVIPSNLTYSPVNLDEVFDALNSQTRTGLSNLIRGEAAAIQGKAQLANKALEYLAPGLQSTSQVTGELTREAPVFDQLLVNGAQALQALASKSQQLTQLISNTATATGAIARQSQALQAALSLLPGTLTRSTTTFIGLQQTLRALNPLVAASKPAVRRLPLFASRLGTLLKATIPTVAKLDGLIFNPNGTGDLTELAQSTPSLARSAGKVFPQLITEMNNSQNQLDYLREYAPDVVAALGNLGEAGSYYDANGHYVRTTPAIFPFTLDSAGQLTNQFPSGTNRYSGLQQVRNRCPGSAVQASPDGSAPESVPGCSTSSVPPGP